MKAVLSRTYEKNQTKGRFLVLNGNELLLQVLTLELPWNDNQVRSSCIPEGTHEVTRIYSPKFGMCFLLHDVLGRSAIEIHPGNFASLTEKTDTTGCILPGLAYEDINDDGVTDIVQSTLALRKLITVLPDKFTLYII
jgi:hypothetical protein